MQSQAPAPAPAPRDRRLRVRAIPILVLVFAEILVGNELALAGSPYPVGWLAAHVVLALLLIGFTGHALRIAVRLPSTPARVAAGLTFLSALGATIAGTVFLVAGQANSALYAMEGLAGIAILADLLLLVWGSVAVPSGPSASAAPS